MPTRVPRLRLVLSALVTLALHATACGAQVTCTGAASGCSVPITASFANVYAAELILSSATTNLVTPVASDFGSAAGVNTPAAITLTVRSNAAYTITVSSASHFFSGGSGSKPATDLQYSTDGFATLKSLNATGSALVTAAPAAAGAVYTIGYNTKYSWTTDTPGTQTLAVTYTITAP